MGKKKLDKLFQEKFNDFTDMPDDSVWRSIETSLDQKKKSRKVIPIWWKLGGAAAVLAVVIFLLNPWEQATLENPMVTDINNPAEKISEENQSVQPSTKDFENSTLKKSNIVDSVEDNTLNNEANIPSEQITNSANGNNNSSKSDSKTTDKNIIQKLNTQNSQVANNALSNSQIKKDITLKTTNTHEAGLQSNVNEVNSISNKNNAQEVVANASNTKNFDLDKNRNSKVEDEKIVQQEKDALKKSIFDEIAAQEAAAEEEVLAENTGGKWSAGPSIAPVYFNAFGQGSPVNSIFVPNSKSGDVTMSYGLSVAYEINKKLSIRSGVHKVDYGYNTNDVEFSSSVEASAGGQIDHVDYTLTSKNLVVSSNSNNRIEALNQNPFLDASSTEVLAASASRTGVMEQQFGYIEVPVELNYALIDKRFGVNLIGGVSSLFLIDNAVSLSSGELTTEIGEANNVNNVNFSTNVGFGVNYKFTSKVKLNIEPVFKYQLNTFSATDGSFQPFSVGVYSGLTFKF